MKSKFIYTCFFTFFLLFGLKATPVFANTYYTSPTGSDSNSGTSTTPFRTVTKGVSVLIPGDTLRIKPGTYSEKITISGKTGTAENPITIIGDSTDPALYPIIDGGDPQYSNTSTEENAFYITNSAWIRLERMKIINSSRASVRVSGSHYTTLRRLIIDYHKYGLLLSSKSSHTLMEYCEIYQSYPSDSTWTQLKSSKWEGGAFTSFGGAGMNIIRYNNFRNQFNSVYFSNTGRTGNYYDANTWIYRNRFENIVDDPYEPESFVFNNHFFHNTLIDTHRMVSFAAQAMGVGPVYVYNNMMILRNDPTHEAATGRRNSAFKIELNTDYYPQGVFVFNNSLDANYTGTNSYALDMLSSTVNAYHQLNNNFVTKNQAISSSNLTLINATLENDLANGSLGYQEPNGYPNTNPLYSNPALEDLRLQANSPARGKSKAVTTTIGFSSPTIITQGADLGAFDYGSFDFRQSPQPIYATPPGGEDPSFPANVSWPIDSEGGYNPPSGPRWLLTLPNIPGDANTDGLVNAADFLIWAKKDERADFDQNSIIDGRDFIIWLTHYGV